MKIVVTHPDAPARAHWVHALSERLPDAAVLAWPDPQAAGADFALVWKPPADFFDAHPALRAVFSAGAGVDHLLRHGGLPPGLPVLRLEDAGMARQMLDYCLHAVLRIVLHADAYEHQQRTTQWLEHAPIGRDALTVGVLGLGALGRQVACGLAAAGFRVLGHARSAHRIDGVECLHGDAQLQAFLTRVNVLILMAPLTDDTRHLIDARRIAWLPRPAWLINVARGALIDDKALLAALDSGALEGAALDVFDTEPLPPEHPFWSHPRIRVTPHVAAATLVEPSANQVADKIRRLLRGEPITGAVERDRGY